MKYLSQTTSTISQFCFLLDIDVCDIFLWGWLRGYWVM